MCHLANQGQQARLLVSSVSGNELRYQARRNLVKMCQETEPALISVDFSFLLHLSEVKYHWPKRGKGKKIVNLLCLMRRDKIPMESVIYFLMIQNNESYTFGVRRRVQCSYYFLKKFQSILSSIFKLKREQEIAVESTKLHPVYQHQRPDCQARSLGIRCVLIGHTLWWFFFGKTLSTMYILPAGCYEKGLQFTRNLNCQSSYFWRKLVVLLFLWFPRWK